jgi:hypothetical protein
MMDERRRHVRAKPLPDLPASVVSSLSPTISESLDVVDISLGGFALVQGTRTDAVGSEVALRLVLPSATYSITACVRWVARGMIGLEIVRPTDDSTAALRRYVGELLERGSRA